MKNMMVSLAIPRRCMAEQNNTYYYIGTKGIIIFSNDAFKGEVGKPTDTPEESNEKRRIKGRTVLYW